MPSAFIVGKFAMKTGQRFERHAHDTHQLAWCASGVLAVTVADRTWVLPPTRALWIPARLPHETAATSPVTMQSAYFKVARCPIRWNEPTVVAMPPLARELVGSIASKGLSLDARLLAEKLLLSTLEPLTTSALAAPQPRDARVKRVTDALLANVADERSLAAFGKLAGASARTLARLFVTETGMTFADWRVHTRVRIALQHLADGVPVARVAERVGYGSVSAFIAAFRRVTGVSPRRYFAARDT